MTMTDETTDIQQFFDSHQVRLSPIWLRDCIRWCKEEALPSNYTVKELKYKVFEQWLLLDLRDVELPCLPSNISNKLKYILNGNYSLQIMKIVDISKPKYWQIQKIRNQTIKNNLEKDETASTKRALMLTLSDGVQEVEAVEYKPISSLNLNLTPGLKIRLMGPITVRRGRLLLENNNIKVIGGEVDTLMISNAAENILAAALKLPLNPNPFVLEESLLSANTDILDNTDVTPNRISNNQSTLPLTNSLAQQPFPNSRNSKSALPIATRLPQQPLPSKINERNNKKKESDYMDDMQAFLEDEEMRINKEIADMLEIEKETERPLSKISSMRKTPDMFEDMDIDDDVFANVQVPDVDQNKKSTESKTKDTINFESDKKKVKNVINLSSSIEEDGDFFDNINLDSHLDQLEKRMAQNQKQCSGSLYDKSNTDNVTSNSDTKGNKTNVSDQNTIRIEQKLKIWTIDKLTKNLKLISNGKFKIKGKYKTVVEKLTLTEQEYHLVVEVEDETGCVTVKVHGDLVAVWAGCTAEQFNNLKSDLLQNMTEAQNKAFKTLQTLKENLQKLDNIVELQIKSTEKYPVLLRIIQ